MVTNSSHDVDIKRLLDDIAAYMAFLTNDAGLSVSIHQLDTLINSFQDNLMPFNNHLCPYCRGLKLYKPVAAECCARQIRLFPPLATRHSLALAGPEWANMFFPFPIHTAGAMGLFPFLATRGMPPRQKRKCAKSARNTMCRFWKCKCFTPACRTSARPSGRFPP